MATAIEAEQATQHPERAWHRGRAWHPFIGLLLPAEVLALTLTFDAGTLARQAGPWAALIGHAALYLAMALASLAAVALLGGRRMLSAVRSELASHPVGPAAVRALVLHLAAFAAFAALTAAVFNQMGRASGTLSAGWAALGLATAGLWALALLPLSSWARLAVALRGPLILGTVLGCGVTLAARMARPELWGALQRPTLEVVRWLLLRFTNDLVYDPTRAVIGTSRFAVAIDQACSGYEGIFLIWAFLAAYLVLFRKRLRFPHVLVLIPIATLGIWVLNAVRIAALIGVGLHISRTVALQGFHSQAGWIAFNLAALGIVAVSQRLRFFQAATAAEPRAPAEAREVNPATPYLLPLLSIIALSMIGGALTEPGFDRLYPLRVLAAGAVLWAYRKAPTGLRPTWSWWAVAMGVLVFAGWMALEPLRPPGNGGARLAEGLAAMPTAAALAWIAFRTVGSVLTVPLAEELAFRGYLARRLISADFDAVPPGRFTWLSFVGSSVLFGALHGRWFAGTLAGMAYALTYYRRGELTDAVLAHAVTNALIAAWVLSTGSWSLWA